MYYVYAVLVRLVLNKVMLCYVMLCYVMLCYVMLCYVMLASHIVHTYASVIACITIPHVAIVWTEMTIK